MGDSATARVGNSRLNTGPKTVLALTNMHTLLIALVVLASPLQIAAQKPKPIIVEAQRDVEIRTSEQLPDGRSYQMRGVLYADSSFQLRKGQRFHTIAIYSEGGCRIRLDEREYMLRSCPWLPGFTDHQSDTFKVIPNTPTKKVERRTNP